MSSSELFAYGELLYSVQFLVQVLELNRYRRELVENRVLGLHHRF